MRLTSLLALVALAAVSPAGRALAVDAAPAPAHSTADLSGDWSVKVGDPAHPSATASFHLTRDGAGWKGTYTPPEGDPMPLTATVSGSRVTFVAVMPDATGKTAPHTFVYTLDGDTIRGTVDAPDGPAPFLATRQRAPGMDPTGLWSMAIHGKTRDGKPRERKIEIEILRVGDHLAGEYRTNFGGNRFSTPITSVTVEGETLTVSVDIPPGHGPSHVDLTGRVTGDSIEGTTKNSFGDSPFTGTRTPVPAPLANGSWTVTVTTPARDYVSKVSIRTDGSGIAGEYATEAGMKAPLIHPALTEHQITFGVDLPVNGETMHLDYSGTIDGDEIKGDVKSRFGTAPFVAKRDAPPGATPAGARRRGRAAAAK